jgi:hypothetical protein
MMRRRRLLSATAGALAVLPFTLSKAQAFSVAAPRGGTPGCALYPISVNYPALAEPNGELRIERFWPAEIRSTAVARWDFDLSLVDDTGIPRSYYAWQLRRSGSGQQSVGNGLRMRFPPGTQLGALATVQRRDARGGLSTHGWAAHLPNATLAVIATARASTGAPPAMELLRFDPSSRKLTLSSGEKRDFDALLIETS